MSVQAELQIQQRLDAGECKDSVFFFVARHVKIETPIGEVIPFRLWPFQKKTLNTMATDNRVIVLKARRLGLSWIALAYALWLAIFQQGSRILILCKNEDDSAHLLDRVRRMRDRIAEDPASAHLLANLRANTGRKRPRDAVTTLDVGQSVIRALVGTESAARSETASLLVLDEFAFQREAAGIWRAALPTAEGGGRVFVISTGNGQAGRGKEFSDQWSRASSGKSGFSFLFWPWDAHPDRDQQWREDKENELGDPDRARVEYPEVPEDAFVAPDVILTYSLSGIDAAMRLGREYDEMLKKGTMPAPDGGSLWIGIDWGENTQAYLVWALESGGIYVPPSEIVMSNQDPLASTRAMIEMWSRFDYWLSEAYYDSAGVQSMRTFITETGRQFGPFNPVKRNNCAPNTVPVAFNKYKDECIGYQKHLFNRARDGKKTRIIAISPKNTELIRQLRGYVAEDKEDDHGPDALTAGIKPVAARHRAAMSAAEDKAA